MAANLMTKAAAQLERQNQQIRKFRVAHAQQEEAILHGATSLAASGAAGLIDSKWKDTDGGPAKAKGVPVNAAAALVLLGVSMIPKLPARAYVASVGAGLANAALYRYALDHVHFTSQ